jgi:nicotinamidase-related amidase
MPDLRLGRSAIHLAIDMQQLFAEPGPWGVPWLPKVLPNIVELARRHPERTVMTRFVPPNAPDETSGAWRDYYRHWQAMTRSQLDHRLLELVEPLRRLAPPARVCDKSVYSAFGHRGLAPWLHQRGADTLVVSGGETDVCVLATVMAAIDRGFRVVLPTDALCSGCDGTHDAMLLLFRERFRHQVVTASTEEVLEAWD